MSLPPELLGLDPATGVLHRPPSHVHLEITSRCNFACVHCSKDFGKDFGFGKTEMTDQVLTAVSPWLATAQQINLNGVGEPLLARCFRRCIELSTVGDAQVSFNTNASLLTKEMAEFLVERGVASITISFEGLESHAAIRGVPFTETLAGLKHLLEARRQTKDSRMVIAIAYTLMRRNIHELPRLMDLLGREAPVDAIHVHPLTCFYEGLRHENPHEAPELERVLTAARAAAIESGTILRLYRMERDLKGYSVTPTQEDIDFDSRSDTLGCTEPFSGARIRADGSIISCLRGTEVDCHVLKQDLDSIWNGAWMTELRRRLLEGRFEDACSECPIAFPSGDGESFLRDLRVGAWHSQNHRFHRNYYRPLPPFTPDWSDHDFMEAPRELWNRSFAETIPGTQEPVDRAPCVIPAPGRSPSTRRYLPKAERPWRERLYRRAESLWKQRADLRSSFDLSQLRGRVLFVEWILGDGVNEDPDLARCMPASPDAERILTAFRWFQERLGRLCRARTRSPADMVTQLPPSETWLSVGEFRELFMIPPESSPRDAALGKNDRHKDVPTPRTGRLLRPLAER